MVDAVVHAGPSVAADVQVIGMADLADGLAVARADRDPKLVRAMDAFAEVQRGVRASAGYLRRPDAVDQLAVVLAAAPNHLSAQVLLAVAQGKAPKTLSMTASAYYTALAVRPMLSALDQQAAAAVRSAAVGVPSSGVRSGLADLRRLRPLADPQARPLIDAWSRFVEAVSSYQQHAASSADVERQRQLLQDEMQKERSDPKLMQQMLRQGI